MLIDILILAKIKYQLHISMIQIIALIFTIILVIFLCMFLHNYYKKKSHLEPAVGEREIEVARSTAMGGQGTSAEDLTKTGQNLQANIGAISWPNVELDMKDITNSKPQQDSELQKRMKECRDKNLSDDPSDKCDFLSNYSNTEYGCGYCISENKTFFGDKNGPLVDKFKSDNQESLCKSGWVPHTSDPKEQCIKKNAKDFCNKKTNTNISQCPDVSETKIIGDRKIKCGWCPIKANGYVSNDAGYPLYPEEKNECNWDMPKSWTDSGFGQLLLDKQNVTKKIPKKNFVWKGWSPSGILDKCEGDCDGKDSSCKPGLKCGHGEKMDKIPGCKGKKFNKGADYCYDPDDTNDDVMPYQTNLPKLCNEFSTMFPCMGENYEKGPHSDACIQDIFNKYSKRGDVLSQKGRVSADIKQTIKESFINFREGLPEQEKNEWTNKLKSKDKNWNKTGYIKLRDRVKTLKKNADSDDYETAKQYYKVVYGTEINPCQKRYATLDPNDNKLKNNDDCLKKIWNDRGENCNFEQSMLDPKYRKRWKSMFPKWKDYLNRNADKPYPHTSYKKGTGSFNDMIKSINSDYITIKKIIETQNKNENLDFDDAFNIYKLCRGTPPSADEIKPWKPCWLSFSDMLNVHRGVLFKEKEQIIVIGREGRVDEKLRDISKKIVNSPEYKKERYIIYNKNKDEYVIKKSNYERDYFPFWLITMESRKIWKSKYARQFLTVWKNDYKQVLRYSGRSKAWKRINVFSNNFDYGEKYMELKREMPNFQFKE